MTTVKTIADIARLAGVSPATVSRALADKTIVNRTTRERIRIIADAHGFRPNQLASRLRTRRTGIVAIAVPLGHERQQHLSDPFFLTLLGHLADELTGAGQELLLSRVIPGSTDWLDRIAGSGMCDGILLIGQSDQFETIERVAAHYRPLVVWGAYRHGQRHCAVGVDNRTGGRRMGERLLERGCRRIAFFGNIQTLELHERYAGLCEALAQAGLSRPEQFDTHFAEDQIPGNLSGHFVATLGRIDGIACASDVIAMHVIRNLLDRGIKVPEQIAIVGFDDVPIAAQTVPAITTIRQDLRRGAKAMLAALQARIAGNDALSLQMEPVLVERDSA